MEFRRGTPANTSPITPTRQFSFVIDPEAIEFFKRSSSVHVLDLVTDLHNYSLAVEIQLLLPVYLASTLISPLVKHAKPPFNKLEKPSHKNDFSPDPDIPEPLRLAFLKEDFASKQALSLLALADFSQADGLVTSSEALINARYSLYQHHKIRIIPPDEFSDIIEVLAHGHSIFWSASNPMRPLGVDLFYQLTHWKNSRLYTWTNRVLPTLSDKGLQEHLRSAFMKRYSFILYARDFIRFYEIQRDYYSRRGLTQRFWMPLAYHVATFYFLSWGLLEELTLIAKYRRSLILDDRECGIKNPKFWNELGQKDPSLKEFIDTPLIADWLTVMADMRHLASHDAIPTPTPIMRETAESKKSHEDILKEVQEEYEDFYSLLPPEFMQSVEPWLVDIARTKKMKVLADDMVLIDRKGRGYFRSPVVSIDYDLRRLDAVIDAFLIKLFSS